jgi:NAD(P)-dependent dehydrogenase (short-subunit alcohol dehydrogenase family)
MIFVQGNAGLTQLTRGHKKMEKGTILKKQVALVTGSSSGIGAGIAKAMGAAGAKVIVNFASSEESANKELNDAQINVQKCTRDVLILLHLLRESSAIESCQAFRPNACEVPQDYYLIAHNSAQYAQPLPAPCRGYDSIRDGDHASATTQAADEVEVLHDWKIDESIQLIENPFFYKQALVAIGPFKYR